jgi:hypothetical protein
LRQARKSPISRLWIWGFLFGAMLLVAAHARGYWAGGGFNAFFEPENSSFEVCSNRLKPDFHKISLMRQFFAVYIKILT